MGWIAEHGEQGQNDALTWCQSWRAQGDNPDVLFLLPGLDGAGVREVTPQGWCNIFWGWLPDIETGQCRLELFFGPDPDPDTYAADARKWIVHRQHGLFAGATFDVEEAPFGGMRVEAHHQGRFMVRCDRQIYARATE